MNFVKTREISTLSDLCNATKNMIGLDISYFPFIATARGYFFVQSNVSLLKDLIIFNKNGGVHRVVLKDVPRSQMSQV